MLKAPQFIRHSLMNRLPFFWDSMMCHLMEIMRKELHKRAGQQRKKATF